VNDFDELIGADVTGAEREKLNRVHNLLVESGPPPALPAALADVPQPGKVSTLRQQTPPRKLALVAAALIALLVTFTIGFATGKKNGSTATPVQTVELSGTSAAPRAEARLDVQRPVSGNVPMTLEVSGLPRSASQYYVVWLVRNGQQIAPCGSFVISKLTRGPTTLMFSVPYSLKKGDTWIVTRRDRQSYGGGAPRRSLPPVTVLKPA